MAVITQPPRDDGDQAHMSVVRSHPRLSLAPVMHRHTTMGTGFTDHWGETLAGESERDLPVSGNVPSPVTSQLGDK